MINNPNVERALVGYRRNLEDYKTVLALQAELEERIMALTGIRRFGLRLAEAMGNDPWGRSTHRDAVVECRESFDSSRNNLDEAVFRNPGIYEVYDLAYHKHGLLGLRYGHFEIGFGFPQDRNSQNDFSISFSRETSQLGLKWADIEALEITAEGNLIYHIPEGHTILLPVYSGTEYRLGDYPVPVEDIFAGSVDVNAIGRFMEQPRKHRLLRI